MDEVHDERKSADARANPAAGVSGGQTRLGLDTILRLRCPHPDLSGLDLRRVARRRHETPHPVPRYQCVDLDCGSDLREPPRGGWIVTTFYTDHFANTTPAHIVNGVCDTHEIAGTAYGPGYTIALPQRTSWAPSPAGAAGRLRRLW